LHANGLDDAVTSNEFGKCEVRHCSDHQMRKSLMHESFRNSVVNMAALC
jgi:hypothetical protein